MGERGVTLESVVCGWERRLRVTDPTLSSLGPLPWLPARTGTCHTASEMSDSCKTSREGWSPGRGTVCQWVVLDMSFMFSRPLCLEDS